MTSKYGDGTTVATCPSDVVTTTTASNTHDCVMGSTLVETVEEISERVVEYPDGRRETNRKTTKTQRPVVSDSFGCPTCSPHRSVGLPSTAGHCHSTNRAIHPAVPPPYDAREPVAGIPLHPHSAYPAQATGAQRNDGVDHRVVLLNAWYGIEGTGFDNHGRVQAALRRNIADHNGRLVLNGNLPALFGFDPMPGVPKVAAIHVRYQGQEHHLRVLDGQHFAFPGDTTTAQPPQRQHARGHPQENQNDSPQHQQGFPPHNNNIEIINSWYGVEGNGHNNGGQVTEQLRRLLREHGHVYIPADQFGMYGFDPVQGVPKVTAVHVRCNGQEHHLRAPEGKVFHWYGAS